MKTVMILALSVFSLSALSLETVIIKGPNAVALANAFKKNGTENVRGTLTVKSLVCRIKAKAGSPQPYTDCEYVTIAALRSGDWLNNDMGTKSAFETMKALVGGGVKTVQLNAEDIRNKYISKVKAKKVVCESNGNSCVASF
jgi:hypothetical protein